MCDRALSTPIQESPQSLLIRALGTTQKILFASQEVDTQLKYDSKLVQGTFLHVLDTGLQDKAVRNQLRPSLLVRGVQDEDPIQQFNVIVSEGCGEEIKVRNVYSSQENKGL